MACLVAAILHGFLGIRLRQSSLLIAVCCAALQFCNVVSYCGTFSRAYRLRELQKKLKRELKNAYGKLSSRAGYMVKKEILRTAYALSCPGLKVGRFHEIERQSALLFTDFVGRQIISLLVAV